MIGLRQLMGGGAPHTDLSGLKRFRLGPRIVVDPLRHTIGRDGRAIAVEPRVMQLLIHFAERPGEILSKDELRVQVWGTHVVDEAVHRAISLLRSALGDTARQPAFIETVPRHGYRLLVTPAAADTMNARPLERRGIGWAAAAAGVAAVALLVSPALRSGPDEAPPLRVVVPQTAALAAAEAPEVADAERQPRPRTIAAAPRPPKTRPETRLETASPAPKPPAGPSATRASPGLAPEAPPSRAEPPGEAPAPPA